MQMDGRAPCQNLCPLRLIKPCWCMATYRQTRRPEGQQTATQGRLAEGKPSKHASKREHGAAGS